MQGLGSSIYLFEDALSPDFCAELIQKFEAHPEDQFPGQLLGANGLQTRDIKKSTDLQLQGELWDFADKQVYNSCTKILAELTAKHYELTSSPIRDSGYTVQRSLPGDYFKPHVDNSSHSAHRMVAIIWYLNNVAEGGETSFDFQDLAIRPRAGVAIAFPPFWTHRHEGLTPISSAKYIVTTFIESPQLS